MPGVGFVDLTQLAADEGCAVRVEPFRRVFGAHLAGLAPLDVGLVVVLLLLVRFVDAQRFFAVDALFFSGSVFVVLSKAGNACERGGKTEKEEVLQDLHGFLVFCGSMGLLWWLRSIVQPWNQPQVLGSGSQSDAHVEPEVAFCVH